MEEQFSPDEPIKEILFSRKSLEKLKTKQKNSQKVEFQIFPQISKISSQKKGTKFHSTKKHSVRKLIPFLGEFERPQTGKNFSPTI